MTDKIRGYSTAEPVAPVKGPNSTAVVADKTHGEASAAAPPPAQSTDHVTLTDSARSLQKVEEAIAKAPVVDTRKVASVKQSINSGTYRINADRIAGKILQLESGLKQ